MSGQAAGTGGGAGSSPVAENLQTLKLDAPTLHELLIGAGYNVIPTDSQKRPLAPQYNRHCPERYFLRFRADCW
jgi:hypothetical protein